MKNWVRVGSGIDCLGSPPFLAWLSSLCSPSIFSLPLFSVVWLATILASFSSLPLSLPCSLCRPQLPLLRTPTASQLLLIFFHLEDTLGLPKRGCLAMLRQKGGNEMMLCWVNPSLLSSNPSCTDFCFTVIPDISLCHLSCDPIQP